jgi:hypothetical protein
MILLNSDFLYVRGEYSNKGFNNLDFVAKIKYFI